MENPGLDGQIVPEPSLNRPGFPNGERRTDSAAASQPTEEVDRNGDEDTNTSDVIERALESVKFVDDGGRRFFQSAFCAIPKDVFISDSTKAMAELRSSLRCYPNALFVYHGVQPGTSKAGYHVNINPYSLAKVLEKNINLDTAGGLTDDLVEDLFVCCCEIDEGIDGNVISYLEQGRLWDGLIALGLPIPNAVVMSGDDRGETFGVPGGDPGKSLHVFFAVTPARPETWLRIQQCLVVLTRGDTNIVNVGRRMRVGGVNAEQIQVRGERGWEYAKAAAPRYQTLLLKDRAAR